MWATIYAPACGLLAAAICNDPAFALRCSHVVCAYLKICPASLTGLSGALRHAVNAVLLYKLFKQAVLLTDTTGPCAGKTAESAAAAMGMLQRAPGPPAVM